MNGKEPSGGPERVYIGLGSNVGDRIANLKEAIRRLTVTESIDVRDVSNVYETEAHLLPGQPSQPDHLNAVVSIDTALSPFQLLEKIKEIEGAAGRDHSAKRWLPRALDLDILVFGNRILSTENLEIPHPRIAERRFVLEPFCDLTPNLVISGTSQTIRRLLSECADTLRVVRTDHTL